MSRKRKSKSVYAEISQNIESAIELSGLSQKEFGEKAGIPYSTLRSYVSGERCPRYEIAQKIADLTGVDVIEFLSSEEKKKVNGDKTVAFYRDYTEIVAYLRSIGFDFIVGTNKNAEVVCRLADYDREKQNNEIVDKIINMSSEEFKKNFMVLENSEIVNELNDAPLPASEMNIDEWLSMKDEIEKAVKDIVIKHLNSIEMKRKDFIAVAHFLTESSEYLNNGEFSFFKFCSNLIREKYGEKDFEKYEKQIKKIMMAHQRLKSHIDIMNEILGNYLP